MRRLTLMIITLSLLSISFSAYSNTYIKAEIGGVSLSSNNISVPTLDPTGIAERISIGHLWGENKWRYGLEAGALYYTNANSRFFWGNITYKGYTVDALGVLKYSFDSGITLFAKGGAAYLHQEATIKTLFFDKTPNISGNKIAPEIALGFGYQFTPKVELDLTISGIFASGDSQHYNLIKTTNTVLLGLAYNF